MDPTYVALLLAVLFAGTHIGLAAEPVRSRLVARFGEWGFRWLFFAVAAATFTFVIVFYADHRFDGPPGPALGGIPALRWPLVAMVTAGVTLMVASFATYAGSPYDVDRPGAARGPRGLERVTRHPFFVGLALFATAHALLATHRVGCVMMLALAVLAVAGPVHQDAKLARRRGEPFRRYLAITSAIPFAAILAGRQQLRWRELPLGTIVLGLAIAAGLARVHDDIFAHRGAWVVLVVVGGALAITVAGWVRERRHPRASASAGGTPHRAP